MAGFLVTLGNRNKWKRLYMVLKGDEQQLLYFENEKVSAPLYSSCLSFFL